MPPAIAGWLEIAEPGLRKGDQEGHSSEFLLLYSHIHQPPTGPSSQDLHVFSPRQLATTKAKSHPSRLGLVLQAARPPVSSPTVPASCRSSSSTSSSLHSNLAAVTMPGSRWIPDDTRDVALLSTSSSASPPSTTSSSSPEFVSSAVCDSAPTPVPAPPSAPSEKGDRFDSIDRQLAAIRKQYDAMDTRLGTIEEQQRLDSVKTSKKGH